MNFFLLYLIIVSFCGNCYASPSCCHKLFYYADFLLTWRCAISFCTDRNIPGNICMSCAPEPISVNQSTSLVPSTFNITKLHVACKDYGSHDAISGHLILSWTWVDGEAFTPSIFMVEARNLSKEIGKWDFVGMTNETFADVSNLNLGFEYQFRISPIIAHQDKFPLITDWISLKELKQNISAPENIRTNFHITDNILKATVQWIASKVYLFPSTGRQSYVKKTIILPGDSLSVVFSNLEFDKNYTVVVSPITFQNLRQSHSVKVWFVTPTCLNITEGSFDICAPGSPLNVKAQRLVPGSKILVTWNPPTYTSSENKIFSYHISVSEVSGYFQNTVLFQNVLVVDKNSTNVTLTDLKSLRYVIEVSAVSKGGKGVPAIVELSSEGASVTTFAGYTVPYYYIIPASLPLLIVFILVTRSVLRKKRQKYKGFPSGVADIDDAMRRHLIPVEKIELREIVGQGAFATVHRGMLDRCKSKEEVAVKVFPAESINRRNMLHEIDILRLIGRHENVVGFIGFTLHVEKMYLVFEYCQYGNLHAHLVSLKPELMYMKSLPPSERPRSYAWGRGHAIRLSSYIYQVAQGMEYISSLKLIHRDIAARNILLFDDRRVKIADFGLSKDVYETQYYATETQKKLPIKWMAPEAIEKQKFSTFTDVWSFGVFMWEVFKLGKEPYPEIKNSNVLQFLKLGYRLEQPHCNKEWYDIMYACWHKYPRSRPRFEELVKKIEAVLEKNSEYTVLI
ncbi:fibroblast growth factor receptor [Trichonephila inaurata madagascariensis]|uniref:receptor protein-tyrosine kinase n=1 Tax=Trichonephila inaurata madagascariensis TaxID=2747483 RepID=A0A8X6IKJ7_9ARAC|nr:fibroblast growth factor receptor [Trichonephila inaurata madagascariensis]